MITRNRSTRRIPTLMAAATACALVAPQAALAAASSADSNGAAGSPVSQIIIAMGGATVVTLLLLWLGLGHKSGKVSWLGRGAALSERVSGLPGWAIFPLVLAATSLLIAVFGMYWDISLHMDVGRDPGPLANPAHYFILFGLFGIFSAGYVGIMLPSNTTERPGRTFIRITNTWYAPLGAVLICACGVFALIGFPLDDIWHRIFGQDVTLWGPTHLMLIGGASMTLIGISVLLAEGVRSNNNQTGEPRRVEARFMTPARRVALSGGLLLGLSTFQAEFDFGLPQFRFVFQPVLLMVAAGIGLVSVRVWAGRGSALGAVAFFVVVRGILALLVGPVLGESTPVFPLYLVEALLVEAIALKVSPTRTLRFGLICGVAIGTIGLAAEWGWTHLVYPLPMPATLASIGIPYGFLAAVFASVVGAWIGMRLLVQPAAADRSLRIGAIVGALGIAALVALSLPKPATPGESATVALTDVPAQSGGVGGGGRNVTADIRLSPTGAANDAQWLTMTSWQGNGLIVDRLEQVGPGHYVTTRPIPVHGHWKSMIRLEVGRSLSVVPVYLPEDTAIPAKGIPALATFTRPFVADHKVLQREQKSANGALTLIAYLVVGAIAILLLMLLVWGLHRLGTPPTGPRRRPRAATAKARPRATSTARTES